jgi:hypothetical protein
MLIAKKDEMKEREEDYGDDGEDHYGLALARCAGCLVTGETGFEGVGVFLL